MPITPISNPANHPWPILGHETAVRVLKGTLIQPGVEDNIQRRSPGGPRHAYLFTGPRQVGKTTLAHVFVKFLLCTDSDLAQRRPCGKCRSCLLAESGNHPDLRMIQPIDKAGAVDRISGMLRVEQASEIIHEAALSPMESEYKCFIIQDAHTANDSFANKLLKTLEEPPPHIILCLTAVDRNQLLSTIVSRCQVIELLPLNVHLIEQALQKYWEVPEEQATLLSRLSSGRIGWSIEQLDNQNDLAQRNDTLEALWSMVRSDRVRRLAYVDELSAKRSQPSILALLDVWTTWWRDVFLAQSGCLHACTNIDFLQEIEEHSGLIAPKAVQQYIYTLKQLERYLRHTTNLRLALDVLLLKLPMVNH